MEEGKGSTPFEGHILRWSADTVDPLRFGASYGLVLYQDDQRVMSECPSDRTECESVDLQHAGKPPLVRAIKGLALAEPVAD